MAINTPPATIKATIAIRALARILVTSIAAAALIKVTTAP